MFINKIGHEHIMTNKNNQDYGYTMEFFKGVLDGCSEGNNSEVGVKLFSMFREQGMDIDSIFTKLTEFIGCDKREIVNNLCFTILEVTDVDDTNFIVRSCGDGYIIKERIDGVIEFEKLDDGEYPKYFIYNYMNPEDLRQYKDGVEFETRYYSKSEYKNIGVASDGLRYIFGQDYEEEFIRLLKERKANAIKRLINREHIHFKDDITINF